MYLKKLIITLLLFFLSLFGLGKVLRLLPNAFYLSNKLVLQGCLKFALLLIVIYLIRKEKIFNKDYFFKNRIGSSIVCALLVYGSLSITFNQVKTQKIFLSDYSHYSYLFFNMSTGFLEEFLFRILIFGYVCQLLHKESRNNYYCEVIFTGLLFGMAHIFNLTSATSVYEVVGIFNQTLFAVAIGTILQSIFFRYQNILLNAIIHGIINYSGGRGTTLLAIKRPEETRTIAQELGQSLLFTAIFITLFVIPIVYFCVKGRKNKMIHYPEPEITATAEM
jgi:membrane protease YdiL (CAAX protease family)